MFLAGRAEHHLRTGSAITVVGDAMVDEYLHGKVSRVAPEAPALIHLLERVVAQPGGAANVAANIAALGEPVELFAVVGDDDPGTRLREILREVGVGADNLLTEPSRPTTTKTRVLADGTMLLRLDREDASLHSEETWTRLMNRIESNKPGIVIISDYQKGLLDGNRTKSLIDWARHAGARTLVDTKSADWSILEDAFLVKPNQAEARMACSSAPGERLTGTELLTRLRQNFSLRNILLTSNSDGMYLSEDSGRAVRHIPAEACAVKSTVGAGDTVLAAVAVALNRGIDLRDAAAFASQMAADVVGQEDTSTPQGRGVGETPGPRESRMSRSRAST